MDEAAVLIGHPNGHKDEIGTGAEDSRLLRGHSRHAGQHDRDCRTNPHLDTHAMSCP